MLLAIDIGNSSTKFGVFESSSLIDKFSIPTPRDFGAEASLIDRVRSISGSFPGIDRVGISSVVPEADETFRSALEEFLKITPVLIDHSFDFGLKIDYHPLNTLGIDRLVNASAAAAKYEAPLIACSFGTATTIDVVSRNSTFLGGAIAPGARMLSEALHLKTSKLPLVSIQQPDSVIGNTTENSISSGVFFGYIGLVEGILERVFEELGETPKVIATGGFAAVVAEASSLIDVVDETLTLEGVRVLMERLEN